MQKVHTEEIDERDILTLDDAELQRAQEMTPHSKAHRDLQVGDDPAEVPHDPDGVSHSVVGMTALVAVMVAVLVAVLLITGGWFGRIGAVAIGLVALPLLVKSLAKRDSTNAATDHN